MPKAIDITGQVFGRLTVLGRHHKLKWLCRCTCGTVKPFHSSNLKMGFTRSCGCFRAEHLGDYTRTHGKRSSPEYGVWSRLRERCNNPNNPGFKNYGGRGISVCARWLEGFENFFEDMGPRPSSAHSIDRINNDGNYEPSNCRWATRTEQSRNNRANVTAVINGELLYAADACKRVGITQASLSDRLARGWSVERAFTEPKNEH